MSPPTAYTIARNLLRRSLEKRELIRIGSAVTVLLPPTSTSSQVKETPKRTLRRIGITSERRDFILKFKSDACLETGTNRPSHGYHQSRTQKCSWARLRHISRGLGHDMLKKEAGTCLRLPRAASEGKARSQEQMANQVLPFGKATTRLSSPGPHGC